jgi:hypothetical protein
VRGQAVSWANKRRPGAARKNKGRPGAVAGRVRGGAARGGGPNARANEGYVRSRVLRSMGEMRPAASM